jgi:hypothetical protein
MDKARLEEILQELETEAGQSERRLWLSPDGSLIGTRTGLYALALDLLRTAEQRDPLAVNEDGLDVFAGRLGGIRELGLRDKAADIEKEAASRERTIVWTGRLSVLALAVLGLFFLYLFFWWYFSPG